MSVKEFFQDFISQGFVFNIRKFFSWGLMFGFNSSFFLFGLILSGLLLWGSAALVILFIVLIAKLFI